LGFFLGASKGTNGPGKRKGAKLVQRRFTLGFEKNRTQKTKKEKMTTGGVVINQRAPRKPGCPGWVPMGVNGRRKGEEKNVETWGFLLVKGKKKNGGEPFKFLKGRKGVVAGGRKKSTPRFVLGLEKDGGEKWDKGAGLHHRGGGRAKKKEKSLGVPPPDKQQPNWTKRKKWLGGGNLQRGGTQGRRSKLRKKNDTTWGGKGAGC